MYLWGSRELEVWLTNSTDEKGVLVFTSPDIISAGVAGRQKSDVYVQDHTRIVFPSPPSPSGYSVGLYFYVVVSGQKSNLVPWSYYPPSVTDVLVRGYDARGAVSEDSVSVDGQLCSSEKGLEGCSLEIYGNNFGSRPSFTKINIGGKECLEARWYPSNEVGLPYLKCKPQLDVVG